MDFEKEYFTGLTRRTCALRCTHVEFDLDDPAVRQYCRDEQTGLQEEAEGPRAIAGLTSGNGTYGASGVVASGADSLVLMAHPLDLSINR